VTGASRQRMQARRSMAHGPAARHSGTATAGRQPAIGAAPAATGGRWAAHRARRAAEVAGQWAPVAGRLLLAAVLAWFGYHELTGPGLWTGYVPAVPSHSTLAIIAVLAHGWVLLVLAVALAVGIVPRAAAAVAAVLLLEIVIALIVAGGLSDLVLRDAGVLGLAVTLTGVGERRLLLRR
jgi:uncharacterized membrane protein YphA (DoxX/SURF4 family)